MTNDEKEDKNGFSIHRPAGLTPQVKTSCTEYCAREDTVLDYLGCVARQAFRFTLSSAFSNNHSESWGLLTLGHRDGCKDCWRLRITRVAWNGGQSLPLVSDGFLRAAR